MNGRLLQVFGVFLGGFVLLAGALFYWQIYRGPQLLARADNPRHQEEKAREPRGRLLDRRDRVLVESVVTDGQLRRRYVYPPLVHVTGFDSGRYGNSGVEANRDADLRGLAGRSGWTQGWDRLLHHRPTPADVRLTVDLDLQEVADQALSRSGHNGAVVLLEADTGRILVLASHPYFDPNQLDDNWRDLSGDPARPFLSRATQGLYAPGSCFAVVTFAAALDARIIALDDVLADVPASLQIGGITIQNPGGPQFRLTVADAFSSAQPVVPAQLGLRLGWAGLRRAMQGFWLDRPLPLEIETTASPLPAQDILTQADLASTAVGQGRLSITPLHMALVMAAIANGGLIPMPHLVESISVGPDRLASASQQVAPLSKALSSEVATALWRALARSADPVDSIGSQAGTSLAGQSGVTELGPGIEPHTWFIGLSPATAPRYAVAVLIENGGPDRSIAVTVARSVVQALSTK
jgi:penicillin-binding protein A